MGTLPAADLQMAELRAEVARLQEMVLDQGDVLSAMVLDHARLQRCLRIAEALVGAPRCAAPRPRPRRLRRLTRVV